MARASGRRTPRLVVQAGLLATPEGVRGPGYIRIEGGRIVQVASGRHRRPDLEYPGGIVAPGFVDLQVNGAAGCDFLAPTPDGLVAAEAHLLASGTVAYLPTLISAPDDRLRAALGFFTGRRGRGPRQHRHAPRILGVHLEGPFLSSARAGAHRSSYLRTPSLQWIGRLLEEFQGVIRLVTLAPELEGALDIIRHLRARRIVVAAGHTDATFEQASAGFDAGVRLATHLFNAMRPYHHREPGIVGAALAHPHVFSSLIADLVHLHPAVLGQVIALKGPQRTILVSDAIAAAGITGGTFTLGDQPVRVEDGAPRLLDGTFAGSVLSMDRAVRNIRKIGVDLADALRMASTTPARLLGLNDAGLAPGCRADLVVLDERFRVVTTIIAGQVVYAA